ncbi:MAG: HAMP domain-containing protein [Deltaproteobacteria bacterium]|nr:HAMP domain-containing protein [Deltaproteobacteria bacterium]
MTFSVRTRLTFWYVSLLTVSLVAFGLSSFYALSRVYITRIDEQIHSVAGMIAHTIVRPPGELRLPRNFDIIFERFFGIRTGGNYIQVLDASGRVAARSSTLESFELPVSDEALKGAAEGRTTYEIVKTFGTYPVRVVTVPVVVRAEGARELVAVVQVGSSLEGMEEIFHYMFYFFGFGIFASVAVASCVGWFLARKALKPVADITRMARRISAERLNERLNITGPEDEIGRLASTFNEMIARLERSFRQVKQFTEDASHELKTPLTVMKGEIEVALRGNPSEDEFKEVMLSTLEEIDRMSHIVKNLLTLARADFTGESGVKMALKPVRLDGIITERFEQLRKIAVTKGLGLEIKGSTPLIVEAEPLMLGQVVYNLIDNAVKYTPGGGTVEISLEREGGSAILIVKDTGIGIAPEDLPYIFDRFYRVDRARTREVGGAGLGLSICREIVESFGGLIEVASEPAKGSTFTVRLPLAARGGGDLRALKNNGVFPKVIL